MTVAHAELPDFPATWRHRHLLDLESLTAEEITTLLDWSEHMAVATDFGRRKISVLQGKTIANVFFENSTRTRNSFSLAASMKFLLAKSDFLYFFRIEYSGYCFLS